MVSTGNILVSAPFGFLPDLKNAMEMQFECNFSYGADVSQVKNLLKQNEFDGWLVSPCPTYMIDQFMVDLCPSLKIIATPSTGSNHMDVNYLKEKDIKVFSLRGNEVINKIYASSEFTFNLMISTVRNTPFASQAIKKGNWRNVESQFRGRELNGLNLGIIGHGRIGTNLSRYSLAFGMNVIAYDPHIIIKEKNIKQMDSLDELFKNTDVIVVCVHLNETTYRMINSKSFDKMKDGVIFINTSRGDVIDEESLLENLENGKIRAAGLDVISGEFSADISNHPLIRYARQNNNLIITPHIAGLTYESEEKAQKAAFDAIKDYLTK